MTILKKTNSLLMLPGSIARWRSQRTRTIYHHVSRVLHARTYLSRCLGLRYAGNGSPTARAIDPGLGYVMFGPGERAGEVATAAIEEIRYRLRGIDVYKGLQINDKKPYLISVIKPAEINAKSAIFRFVTNSDIVDIVAHYLNCLPLLTYVAVWYSPNVNEVPDGSQLFHLDTEDYRQIKGFLFIEDVDLTNGPFTLIDARRSELFARDPDYQLTRQRRRLEDNIVEARTPGEALVQLTGPSGTLALVDTSRCFHYGSRHGTKARVVLTFQYMTPFAFTFPWIWRRGNLLRHLWSESLSDREAKIVGMRV